MARAIDRRESGFTLIEVMVVVVIIAVLSSILVISAMPGGAALAEKEARRLAALLELASAEARTSGQGIAWSPERDGYSFWQRSDDGDWARFPDTSVYRRRSFDGRTELGEVLVDDRVLPEGERINMAPYGTRSLIAATITGGNARITLRGGVLGRISLQRDSDRAVDSARPNAGPRLHPG
jgi:type II secretion system protein H